MNIVTAGMLISFSGMIVVAAALLGVVPPDNKLMIYIFVAIGWVFILFGVAVRIYGLKLEKKIKEAKEAQLQQKKTR